MRIVHIDDFQDQLQIERLAVDHVGNYSCNAKNIYGADHIAVQVLMKFAPKWAVSELNSTIALNGVAGERVEIDCRSNGHPTPHVRVYKGEHVDILAESL